LVQISLYVESQPPNVFSLPTFLNHETPPISEEEPTIPFVYYPPPFPLPIWVPLGDDVKVGKSRNSTVDPSLQPSSTFTFQIL